MTQRQPTPGCESVTVADGPLEAGGACLLPSDEAFSSPQSPTLAPHIATGLTGQPLELRPGERGIQGDLTPPDSTSRTAKTLAPIAYSRAFWFAYTANLTLCTAHSLLFRYSDLVQHLGGNEFQLGLIVGFGTIGSLITRFVLGGAIDRHGARVIWSVCLFTYVLSVLAHLLLYSALDWPIFALRLLFSTAAAGAFGAQLTFVSLASPPGRLAEVIGTLGTAGFLGMLLGAQLGDLVCGPGPGTAQIAYMLLVAAGLAGIALFSALQATRGQARPTGGDSPGLAALLRLHWPGAILLASAAMGLGIGMYQVFGRPFTKQLGQSGMSIFFGCYALSGFGVRLIIRRLPGLVGNPPLILIGFALMVASILCMPLVRGPWQLLGPAFLVGASHAFVFPTVMAQGSVAFPIRYRGFAATLMLGLMDMGVFLSSPAFGWILRAAPGWGLPAYPTMFLVAAGSVALAAGVYAWEWLRYGEPVEPV